MSDSIEGKVAAVVDDTTLVLNVGRESGVREGMLFAIVSEHQEVSDPDSGQSLGRWESVKVRVIVTHVQERMCTVRSPLAEDDKAQVTGTLSAMMVRHAFGIYGSRKESRHSLPVRASDMSGRVTTAPIAVGDIARVISIDEVTSDDVSAAPAATAQSEDMPSSTYAQSPDSSQTEEPATSDEQSSPSSSQSES